MAAKLNQGHADGSLDVQNGWILSVQSSMLSTVYSCVMSSETLLGFETRSSHIVIVEDKSLQESYAFSTGKYI